MNDKDNKLQRLTVKEQIIKLHLDGMHREDIAYELYGNSPTEGQRKYISKMILEAIEQTKAAFADYGANLMIKNVMRSEHLLRGIMERIADNPSDDKAYMHAVRLMKLQNEMFQSAPSTAHHSDDGNFLLPNQTFTTSDPLYAEAVTALKEDPQLAADILEVPDLVEKLESVVVDDHDDETG